MPNAAAGIGTCAACEILFSAIEGALSKLRLGAMAGEVRLRVGFSDGNLMCGGGAISFSLVF